MHRVLKCFVLAGLIAGTVDIGAASIINMSNPLRILLAIASGWLGRAAFQDGASPVVLGLVLQWAMSMLIAAFFAIAADKMPTLARRWVFWGAAYGVVVYIVMSFVVVPLSAAPFKIKLAPVSVAENLLAMLVFGWIVAFTANRFLTDPQLRAAAVLR
jgi:uncharacterized membrane protein YagU involved in acid resistance